MSPAMSSINRKSRWITVVAVVALACSVFFGFRVFQSGDPEVAAVVEAGRESTTQRDGNLEFPTATRDDNPSMTEHRKAADSGYNGSVDIPVIDLMAVTGGQEILDQLGIDRNFDSWAEAHGFAWGFDPSASPYANLTIEELEELAEAGDQHAALELAVRISKTDIAAAVDQMQQLAMDGMMEAVIRTGTMYGGIYYALANPGTSNLTAEEIAALRGLQAQGVDPETENMAWAFLYDSYMGYPRSMGTPSSGDPVARLREACNRAAELRRLIEAQALEQGRTMPPIEPAPFGIGSIAEDPNLVAACPGEILPTADFGNCQPIRIFLDGNYYDAYVCP